jgi:hypothetical protein
MVATAGTHLRQVEWAMAWRCLFLLWKLTTMTTKEHQKWRCTTILRIYMDLYIYTYVYIPSKLGKINQKMKDVTNTMRIWLTRKQGCHLWRIDSTNNLEYHPTDRNWLVTTASYNMLQPIYWWDNLNCSAQDLCAATGFVAQMDSKMEKEQDVTEWCEVIIRHHIIHLSN